MLDQSIKMQFLDSLKDEVPRKGGLRGLTGFGPHVGVGLGLRMGAEIGLCSSLPCRLERRNAEVLSMGTTGQWSKAFAVSGPAGQLQCSESSAAQCSRPRSAP